MSEATPKQFVAVLDFGAQYGQLIARRVRDLHVYSEIVPCDIPADELAALRPSALILSGGPASVYAEDAPSVDPAIFSLGLPVLGFCYGHQIMAVTLGGEVAHSEVGEYGPATIAREGDSALFAGTPDEQTVWMSHRDAVSHVPGGLHGVRRASPLFDAVPPGGAPHRARSQAAGELPLWNLRARCHVDHGQHH